MFEMIKLVLARQLYGFGPADVLKRFWFGGWPWMKGKEELWV